MAAKEEQRIAFFIAKWHVHQQAADSALMFAEAGFKVDVWLYQAPQHLYAFETHPNIELIDCSPIPNQSVTSVYQMENIFHDTYRSILHSDKRIGIFGTGGLSRVFTDVFPVQYEVFFDNDSTKWGSSMKDRPVLNPQLLAEPEYRHMAVVVASSYYDEIAEQLESMGLTKGIDIFNAEELLDQYYLHEVLLPKSKEYMEGKHYKAFIGVEKLGMIWAGIVAEQLDVPYLYHSLELYTSDHPSWSDKKYDLLREMESTYHQKAAATIIQDREREQIILSDNRVQHGKSFYVPISISDSELVSNGKHYFYDRYGIPQDRKLILYLTMISRGRYCEELIQAAQQLPDDYQVVIHGPVTDSSYFTRLKALDERGRVVFSTEIVDQSLLQTMIADAHIGLAFYRSFPLNDQLTVFSSEKIARYLHCGIPFISFDYPAYRQFLDDNQCGAWISNFSELEHKLNQISQSYEQYSANSRKTFEKYFIFEDRYKAVLNFVQDL